jgi:hypothetical protein
VVWIDEEVGGACLQATYRDSPIAADLRSGRLGRHSQQHKTGLFQVAYKKLRGVFSAPRKLRVPSIRRKDTLRKFCQSATTELPSRLLAMPPVPRQPAADALKKSRNTSGLNSGRSQCP